MKTADEMFEELGYKCNDEDNDMFVYEKDIRYIVFLKKEKTLMLPCQLTMEELQGIKKKCEELKWI